MSALDDLDLGYSHPPGTPGPGRNSHVAKIVLALSVVLVAALLAAFWVHRVNQTQSATTPPPGPTASARKAPPEALGAGPAGPLPPLAEFDGYVRDAVGRLSSAKAVATWLSSDDLAQQFTSVVQGVSEGHAPMRQLARLRPSSPFNVVERNGRMVIDPASYHRYDGIADAVASLDPIACSRVYGTLKPRLEEAYAQLGIDGSSLDAAVEKAIASLLRTPVPSGDIAVQPHGGLYAYADPGLEALTPAQKLLLRTGPDNARRIQARLREIAVALGIPPERLP